MDERKQAIIEKRIAIIETVTSTAQQIVSAAKDYPKKNKGWWSKKYIRGLSRQNKKKAKLQAAKIALAAAIGRMQIQRIISQPIPKFPKGSE